MRKPNPNLSPRQTTALKLCAEGLCHKQIAEQMNVSVKTVEHYFNGERDFKGIHAKLGTNSVALLTQWALKHGIAEWNV